MSHNNDGEFEDTMEAHTLDEIEFDSFHPESDTNTAVDRARDDSNRKMIRPSGGSVDRANP